MEDIKSTKQWKDATMGKDMTIEDASAALKARHDSAQSVTEVTIDELCAALATVQQDILDLHPELHQKRGADVERVDISKEKRELAVWGQDMTLFRPYARSGSKGDIERNKEAIER